MFQILESRLSNLGKLIDKLVSATFDDNAILSKAEFRSQCFNAAVEAVSIAQAMAEELPVGNARRNARIEQCALEAARAIRLMHRA